MNCYLNWSGGKDATLALYKTLQDPAYQVKKLLTNISRDQERISMHGVRKSLLFEQVKQLKVAIPLEVVELWEGMSMEDYSALMTQKTRELKQEGLQDTIFGDIFLEDLRTYREKRLESVGIQAHFPLWKQDTLSLLEEFIGLGFKAVVVCTNARLLDESFVGRQLDTSFLADLPSGVDPCGENGEFHTFVYDGPLFEAAVPFEIGEKVLKEYPVKEAKWDSAFWYQDLTGI